jgi:hypothetical protein
MLIKAESTKVENRFREGRPSWDIAVSVKRLPNGSTEVDCDVNHKLFVTLDGASNEQILEMLSRALTDAIPNARTARIFLNR